MDLSLAEAPPAQCVEFLDLDPSDHGESLGKAPPAEQLPHIELNPGVGEMKVGRQGCCWIDLKTE